MLRYIVAFNLTKGGSTLIFIHLNLCTLFSCEKEIIQSSKYAGLLGFALQSNSSKCLLLIIQRRFIDFVSVHHAWTNGLILSEHAVICCLTLAPKLQHVNRTEFVAWQRCSLIKITSFHLLKICKS